MLSFLSFALSELKLGNGTSVLIFANIASALPASVGGCAGGREACAAPVQ
jgi:protein transport protein SEC61 subunit alpha